MAPAQAAGRPESCLNAVPSLPAAPQSDLAEPMIQSIKKTFKAVLSSLPSYKVKASTRWLHFREERANFLPLHDVCDDVACDFRMCAVGDDHRRPTLEGPECCFHLMIQTPQWSIMQPSLSTLHFDIKSKPLLADLGFHPPEADSGLGAVRDGLLVSGIKDIDELGIICSWGAVV